MVLRYLTAFLTGALLVVGVPSALSATGAQTARRSETAEIGVRQNVAANSFVYPLKVSKNRRYLVDQRGRPFMIIGDSPQSMIGNLSIEDAASFIADRQKAGFNALLVDLLCVKYTGCNSDGTTYDGIEPFETPGDLSTPNPAYFARASAMIKLAANAGIVVFLDPIETGGWLGVLQQNGVQKDFAFGQFLGRMFGRFPNIVWSNGNDFQTWSDPADDAVVLAVARGIQSVDPANIQTIELNYLTSASLDDPRWCANHQDRRCLHVFADLRRGSQGVRSRELRSGLPRRGRL